MIIMRNMKTKYNSDVLPLKKTLALYNIIFVRSVFNGGRKYYPEDFMDEKKRLCKLIGWGYGV